MASGDCIQKIGGGREHHARGNSHAMGADSSAAALPEWIELIPAGVFKGRDGRGPYRNEYPARVVAATRALGMTAGLPIDFDHAIDLGAPQGQPAPAAGWIKELRLVGGAIQGRVEWTAAGAKALAAKLYRYISPVFEFAGDGTVQRLLRAAVTNNPNLYLKAIASAGGGVNNLHEQCRRTLDRIRQFEAAPNSANGRAAHNALMQTAELAAARFLDPGELELCRLQGVNPARFILARRERATARPLALEPRPALRVGLHAKSVARASDELAHFLRKPGSLDSLQYLVNADALLQQGTAPASC